MPRQAGIGCTAWKSTAAVTTSFTARPWRRFLRAVFAALPDAAGGIAWRLFSAGLFLDRVGRRVGWRSRFSGSRRTPGAKLDRPSPSDRRCCCLLPLAAGNLNLGQMNVLVLVLL